MEITHVVCIPFQKDLGSCKAYVGFVIDDAILLSNCLLVQHGDGVYHLRFPQVVTPYGISEIFHPLNNEARDALTKAAVMTYEKEKQK